MTVLLLLIGLSAASKETLFDYAVGDDLARILTHR